MKKREGRKEILGALGWMLSSKVLTYFLLVILGNFYIVSEYGKSVFLLAIYNTLILGGMVGVPNAIVPWIVKKKNYKSVLKILLYLQIGLAISSVGIAYLVSLIKGYNLSISSSMILLGAAVIFYWVTSICTAFFNAEKRYDFINEIPAISIILTIIFALLLKNLQGFGIILSYVIGFGFTAAVLGYSQRKNLLEIIKAKVSLVAFREYLMVGAFVVVSGLSFYFLSWADSIFLGILSNLENVGKYGIASAFTNFAALIPISLSAFVITKMSEIKNKKRSEKVLRRIINISYFFTLMASMLLVSLSALMLRIFFPKYLGIEPFIAILLVGITFYSVYFLRYGYFIGKMNISKKFYPVIIAAIINLILDLILIKPFGVYGVCIATAIAQFSAFLFFSGGFLKVKEIILMILFTLTIPLCYYLSYAGILLLIFEALLIFKIGLVDKEDVIIVYSEVRKFISRRKN
jgi:O-antigen/teichoic acid export membrane protein